MLISQLVELHLFLLQCKLYLDYLPRRPFTNKLSTWLKMSNTQIPSNVRDNDNPHLQIFKKEDGVFPLLIYQAVVQPPT